MNNISQKLESRKPELPTDAIDKPTLEKVDAEREKIIENFSELGKSIFNKKNFPEPDLEKFSYKPNKTYLIDGEKYRTDDRSIRHKINDAEERQNIDCLRNGDLSVKLQSNSTYTIDGHEYRTDDNGKVYCVDDKFRSSIEYKLNGYEFKTDDVGKRYLLLKFRCPPWLDKKEFVRQLKLQEAGLNNMSIKRWLENIENYKENGRAPESKIAQRLVREKALADRVAENRDKGMNKEEATAEAKEWLKGQAVLHNPDQIAGGEPTDVSEMGDSRVNNSIGSQWRKNISTLENYIKEVAQGKTEEELSKTNLDVLLETEE